MAYAGKTANNSTSQMDSVAWSPKAATVKPTIGGESNGLTIKGQNLERRTSSSAAENEKLFETRSDAPTK